MRDERGVDPEYVVARLDEAGATLMALPGRGVFPTGFRSSMPDYLQTPDGRDGYRVNPYYSASAAPDPRPPIPGSKAIAEMEQVYFDWVPLLPWATTLQQRRRRILLLRSLMFPLSDREDRHVWSWRKLGAEFGIDHKTAEAWHKRTVDELVCRIRTMPRPCATTLARIALHRPNHEIPQTRIRFPTRASMMAL